MIGHVPVSPGWVSCQIISEDVESSVAAIGVESCVHDFGIIFELNYLRFESFHHWAVSTRALRINIGIS